MPPDRGRDPDSIKRDDRRRRNRTRRSQRYGGKQAHKVEVCPECRAHLPYVEGVSGRPSKCPTCGRRFRCPECSRDLDGGESLCPRCEEVLDPDAPAPEETFTWDG